MFTPKRSKRAARLSECHLWSICANSRPTQRKGVVVYHSETDKLFHHCFSSASTVVDIATLYLLWKSYSHRTINQSCVCVLNGILGADRSVNFYRNGAWHDYRFQWYMLLAVSPFNSSLARLVHWTSPPSHHTSLPRELAHYKIPYA